MYRDGESTSADPAAGLQQWAHGRRRVGLAMGMLVYPLITVAGVARYSSGAAAMAGYSLAIGFAACCVLGAIWPSNTSRARAWVLLGVMTALFIATIPLAREYSFYLCAVVVSMATLMLRRRVLPIAIAAVLASLIVPWAVPSWHSDPGWLQAVMIVFTVLLVYAFSEIARANLTLVEARAEVVRLASEAERNRIARDLHDLVGHSLTAITVKSSLARQLAENESSPSLQEITEVEKLSRQALADMRAAVSGYREVTLAGELAQGRELLRAAGVAADLPTATDTIDAARQELFGWAVREGVTNVVRHARATRCTVTVSAAEVEIRDDGIGGTATAGNGLAGLRERIAAAGGTVEAGPLSPRGWRLKASFGTAAPLR